MRSSTKVRVTGVKLEEPSQRLKDPCRAPTDGEEKGPSSNPNPKQDLSQSTAQRRLLRAKYRALKDDIAVGKELLARLDSERFDTVLGSMENLHSLVTRPREQVTDAEALLDISSTFLASVKDARRGSRISPADFVTTLIHNFGAVVGQNENSDGPHIDWVSLGLQASAVFSEAPGFLTMLGPLKSKPKVRKIPVQRRQRDRATESIRPQEVGEAENDKMETDKNMKVMFKTLRQLKSTSLEALVLNRKSFSQTVENIFALSFLVKDGRAKISTEKGRHIVAPKNFPTAQERENGQGSMSQFVFRFDYKDWKVMQGMVELGRELMPHRTRRLTSQTGSVTPVRKNCRNRAKETPVVSTSTSADRCYNREKREVEGGGSSQGLARKKMRTFKLEPRN